MRQVLDDLCALLLEQKLILERMLELSTEEREIIIHGESSKLEEIVRQELRELSKLGGIEKRRLALHKTLAQEFRLPEQYITVSAIAERAQQDERETITGLQMELTDLINRHTAINNENKELIKAHMEYSETMLELMVGSEDPLNNFYGMDGKSALDKKKTTGFFDGHA